MKARLERLIQSATRTHLLVLTLLCLLMSLPGLASIPVIDRDEARYAQASVQMAETGDLLNIRFQDHARNKKPAGAYWLQTAMIKTFARDGQRRIWAQRLPSVLAGIIAVWATYWGVCGSFGRRRALVAAAILATSMMFVFETHIAKTDALMLASSAGAFAALLRLQVGPERKAVWVFWIALGASIMIKGPIILVIAALALVWSLIWNKTLSWARPLLAPLPILLFVLIWLPWAIAIYVATDGAFFVESLGNDMGGKMITAQEKHPGPPGYHLLLLPVTFWPGILLLIPGIAAIRAALKQKDYPNKEAMRLAVLWVIPFWILIEVMPTKLPHYSLPLFPALAMIAAMAAPPLHPRSRKVGAGLFSLVGLILAVGLYFALLTYGQLRIIPIIFLGMTSGLILWASVRVWTKGEGYALAAFGAALLSITAYQGVLPALDQFQTSQRLAAQLTDKTHLQAPDYTEPSFVYHTDATIRLGGQAVTERAKPGEVWIIDLEKSNPDELSKTWRGMNMCAKVIAAQDGFNYSKGDPLRLRAVQLFVCDGTQSGSQAQWLKALPLRQP